MTKKSIKKAAKKAKFQKQLFMFLLNGQLKVTVDDNIEVGNTQNEIVLLPKRSYLKILKAKVVNQQLLLKLIANAEKNKLDINSEEVIANLKNQATVNHYTYYRLH